MLATIRTHVLFAIVLVLAPVNAILILTAWAAPETLTAGPAGATEPFLARSNLRPPASYAVGEGETIFDAARKLGIPFYDLVLENRWSGEEGLVAGRTLSVPVFAAAGGALPAVPAPSVRAVPRAGFAPVSVYLSADLSDLRDGDRFFWDLGNHRYAFDATARAFYTRPGAYRPRLVIVDAAGRYRLSEPAAVAVADLPAAHDGLPRLTAERVGDLINVSGRLVRPDGIATDFDDDGTITQTVDIVRRYGKNTLIATAGGFSRVRLTGGGGVFEFLLFVSPLPARLSAEPEYDWYKTQFDTGMYGNCGPAAVGSAIRWATGEDLTVEKIREEIGMPYPNGAVDYDNLLDHLRRHGVPAAKAPLGGLFDIFRVIDDGGIVIVSFNCGKIRPTTRDETTDFFDRYYPDATGHYLLIKGYTLDRRWFIVYDAIPGEWDKNDTRYRDGASMIGRNRFFRTDEVMSGISQRHMLVVRRRTLND